MQGARPEPGGAAPDAPSLAHKEASASSHARRPRVGSGGVQWGGRQRVSLPGSPLTSWVTERWRSRPTAPVTPPITGQLALRVVNAFALHHCFIRPTNCSRPSTAPIPRTAVYYCKQELFGRLTALARDEGYAAVVDGSNADDRGDHRPGRQAAREFRGPQPARRGRSDQNGDQTAVTGRGASHVGANRRQRACHPAFRTTWRFPPRRSRVSSAPKTALRGWDFRVFRVRHHDTVARLELGRDRAGPARSIRTVAGDRGARDQGRRLSIRRTRPRGYRVGSLNEPPPPPPGVMRNSYVKPVLWLAVVAFLLGHLFSSRGRSKTSTRSTSRSAFVRTTSGSHQPHPPGYPVYVALGKLGTRVAGILPVADAPWRPFPRRGVGSVGGRARRTGGTRVLWLLPSPRARARVCAGSGRHHLVEPADVDDCLASAERRARAWPCRRWPQALLVVAYRRQRETANARAAGRVGDRRGPGSIRAPHRRQPRWSPGLAVGVASQTALPHPAVARHRAHRPIGPGRRGGRGLGRWPRSRWVSSCGASRW